MVYCMNTQSVNTRWWSISPLFQTTGKTRTFVNGAMIVREDIQAENGVIHILDRVLGPISTKTVGEYLQNPDDPQIRAE